MTSSFLDRESTVAPPGFNRFLVPARRSRGASVDWPGLCILDFQSAAHQADRYHSFGTRGLGSQAGGLDFLHRHRVPGFIGRCVRPLGGKGRSAQIHVHRRAVLRRRLPGVRVRHSSASAVADLPGLRRARRLRARHRLHLAGVDADQVVPRSSRHGHRHGHHGLRRRRPHRGTALGDADGAFQDRRPRTACSRPSSPWASSTSCT